ncbi:PX domain-containing protein [Entamoeba marina]
MKPLAVPITLTLQPMANKYDVELTWCSHVRWSTGPRRYSDFLKLYELICEKYDEGDFPEFPGKLLVHNEEMLEERRYDLTLYCHALLSSTTTFLEQIVVAFFKIPTAILYMYLPRPHTYFTQYKAILTQKTLRDLISSANNITTTNDQNGDRWLNAVKVISAALLEAPDDYYFTVEEYINPLTGDITIPKPHILTNENVYDFGSITRNLLKKVSGIIEVVQQQLYNVDKSVLDQIFDLKVETQAVMDAVLYENVCLDRDSADVRMLYYRTICDIDVMVSEKLMPLLGKSAVVCSLGRTKHLFWLPYNDNGPFMKMDTVFK